MSTPPSVPGLPPVPGQPYGPVAGAASATGRWGGRRELRADLRGAALLALCLALVGVPAGLLWRMLAPRADFRITETGPVPIGTPSTELLVAGDGVFVLVMVGAGLLAGAVTWALRRRRGVAVLLALALGTTATGLVAWQVGELLAPGPTRAQLTDVGARVSTGLEMASLPALAVAPFVALLVYVLGVLVNADDSLGRDDPAAPFPAAAPSADGGAGPGRPELADLPPAGRPTG